MFGSYIHLFLKQQVVVVVVEKSSEKKLLSGLKVDMYVIELSAAD